MVYERLHYLLIGYTQLLIYIFHSPFVFSVKYSILQIKKNLNLTRSPNCKTWLVLVSFLTSVNCCSSVSTKTFVWKIYRSMEKFFLTITILNLEIQKSSLVYLFIKKISVSLPDTISAKFKFRIKNVLISYRIKI